jgi:sulfotransferase
MIEKQFYFLSGLPRSGSTVLASILNQNPSIYVTTTSPLLDLLCLNEVAWKECPSVIANPNDKQLENISTAIINGCWRHIPQHTIIDKHRGWGRNTQTIERIFKKKPKLIITVRDIVSILASFMRLLRESNQRPHFIDKILQDNGRFTSDFNRCDVLWTDFIRDTWDSFLTAWNVDRSNILLIEYDNLVNNGQYTTESIYDFLEMPRYQHDFSKIENKTIDKIVSKNMH